MPDYDDKTRRPQPGARTLTAEVAGPAPGRRTLTEGLAAPGNDARTDARLPLLLGAESLILDEGSVAPEQMSKTQFLATLRTAIVAAVEQALGRVGAAAGCPYIDRYFAKYGALPATKTEALIHQWLPVTRHVRSAADLVSLVAFRVSEAANAWSATGRLPPDLAAADPEVAAAGAQGDGASLDAMESRLGPGAPVDDAVGARASQVVGQDVSGARVHTGPAAAAMASQHDAAAFAVGNNVVMGGNAPAAGTVVGDVLLAHELAHTAQQKGAASDPVARKKPIGGEDQAAERDAGLARLGNFAGAIGDVMQTGLQLQRCQQPAPAKITELRGKEAEQKLAELGGKLVTDPDFTDGRKAVVGSHIQYTVLGARTKTSVAAVHQWTHDGPDGFHMESITGVGRPDAIPGGPNGMFVNLHDVGSTTIPLSKVGTYTTKAWVRAGVDNGGAFEGYDLHIDHSIDVAHLLRATNDARIKLGEDTDSFQKFHDKMDVQTTLLRPGGPEQQNRGHQFQIATNTPNPAPIGTGTLPFSAQDTRADKTKPFTYHWYVSPQTKDKPPETLGGKSMVAAGGRTGYDFGVGPNIAMPAEHGGFWVIWYQAKDDKGADAGEASYLQTILSGSDMKSLEKHDKYMSTLDDLGGKLEGERVPIKGVHVSSASGAPTQLRLFVGRKKGEPSTFLLIDVTPGLDPKSNRFEYTSSSGDGVIREFLSNNKYPKGMFRFHVTSNALGIDVHEHQQETSGQGTFDRISSNLSWGGMAALGVGILAAPFTRGQSLQVALVISGGLTAAGAAVSIYDRLQNAEVSATGVALDVVTIASSLINVGGAVGALKSGPGVLLANRATKFVLWSNFAADGVSALLIGVEGAQQITEILDNDSMSPKQKRGALLRVVTNLAMTGALLAVSNLPASKNVDGAGSKAKRPNVRHAGHDEVASMPVQLLGETHTLRIIDSGNGSPALVLCSNCDFVLKEIDSILAQTTPKGPTKSLRARLERLRSKVAELEKKLGSRETKQADGVAELDQIAAHLRDISQKFPSANPLCVFCSFKAEIDYDLLAKNLGFERIRARSHGRPIFRRGNEYISPDADRHNGGIWKKATGDVDNLSNRAKRDGTFNEDLTEMVGP